MAVVDALVRLKADTAQFSKAMSDATKATDNVSKSADKTAGVLSKKLAVGLGLAASAAGAFAIKLGRDSVKAAQTSAAAQNRLRKLLLNTNGATEEQIQILFKQGQALESLTGITAENITVVQSQLATFDLHGSTIGKLTPAILDYVVAEKGAAAGADEFRMMTTGLAQAINGNFGALTKQGFVLDANTKKMIASGTENERAAAIVDVLGFTYRDFAKTALTPAQKAQADFTRTVGDVQKALGFALIPVIGEVALALSNTFSPALTKIQATLEDGKAIGSFIGFIKGLGKNILDFVKAIVTVFEPVFTGLIIPAIKLAIGAVIGFIKVLGSIGRFIQNNAAAFQVLVGAVVAVAAAMAAYIIQVKVVNAVHKTFILVAAAKGKAIKMLTRGFKTLNLVMKLNPIGAIIAAVTLLGVGFVMLYKKSETFRGIVVAVGKAGLIAIGALIRIFGVLAEGILNVVLGPAKLLMKVMGFLNPEAAKVYDSLKNMTDGVGNFFDNAAKKVEGYSKNLDNLNKKKVTGPKVAKPADTAVDLAGLGRSDKITISDRQAKALAAEAKKAADAAKKLAEMKRNLQEAVEKYNDYLKSDFTKSFMKGADAARDAVANALDNLNAVFEAKGKMLSGKALASLRAGFDKVKKDVLIMSEQLAAVAGQIEAVSAELDKATSDLEKALEERASAMKKFGELLATPFGEPSDVQKALSSAEATVDSIIGMYDQLVDLVNQRFTELAPGARDAVKAYLFAQTNGLIDAARMRVKAIKVLESAQDRLDNLIGDQKDFSKSLTGSLRSFATAIADLSQTDSKATLTVIKTATGMVITQLKKSTGGVDTITNQLKQRLKTIADFATNANKLLASGLNRDYVRQLLEAGPEAAGQAVAALASANASQISEINSLYGQIGTMSDEFGVLISDKMYNEAVAMATAFRDGAALGVELINASMTDIVSNISAILGVLGNTGLTNASALVNALIAEFDRQSKETVGPATQLVVDKIKATIEALGAIGLTNAQAFINGLISALTGKDNLNNVDLSATAIKTNIDTIMKLLAPEALTSGLGLINSLISAFGGTNLTSVTASATAVKDSITTAMAALRTLGTELATDLAQGLFDKLTAEKARLVALAASIAAAIAAAMQAAAASIGVGVEGLGGGDSGGDFGGSNNGGFNSGPLFDDPVIPPSASKTPKVITPKAIVPKTSGPGGTPPKIVIPKRLTPSFMDKNKDGIPDLIAKPIIPSTLKSLPKVQVGKTSFPATSSIGKAFGNKLLGPPRAPKPSPVPTKTVFGGSLKSSPGPTQIATAQRPINVNISTQKVVPTVTATTISNAIDKARNRRK